MNMTFQIAKTELRNLFYSPVAWFLAIVFLVQCAVMYTNLLSGAARVQEINLENMPDWKEFPSSLTSIFLVSSWGVYGGVLQNLYLFLPLLTMGLMSREINNGTIKLLYSSPIKLRQIVLGKYLAIMAYNVILLLLLSIFLIATAMNVSAVDYGLAFSGLLGFYLLVCAYTAIGLFLSSLTTYQIVSAIGTFVVILILSYVGQLWQKYDFVRDLTYFLSLAGRTQKMLRGLITTKDVIYFIVVVYMFLGFTLFKLKSGRESRPWYVNASRYLGVIISALLIGYVSSRPVATGYWDTTAGNVNTIDTATQKIIKGLGNDPLEITLYTNMTGDNASNGFPEARINYLDGLWEDYVRFKPDITFKYEFYYDNDPASDDSILYRMYPKKNLKQIAAVIAETYDTDFSRYKSPEEMRKIIDLKPERYRLVMQLKYKGRTEFLRTFQGAQPWPQEHVVAASLKRLLMDTVPKIYYLAGNLERSIYKDGERTFTYHSSTKLAPIALVNNGFDVDTISLDRQDIPSDATLLVIADPKIALSATTLAKLKQYIDKGGNLLVNGEPGKQQILNPLIQHAGLQFIDGQLVQPTYDETPEKIYPRMVTKNNRLLSADMDRTLNFIQEPRDTVKFLMVGATAITHSDSSAFTVKPLIITTPPNAWLKTGRLVIDSTAPVYNPQEGDSQGPYPTLLTLTRQINNKEQRIMISGDADFMTALRANPKTVQYIRTMYSWFSYGEFPIHVPIYEPKDTLLKISRKNASIQKIVYVWLLPASLLAMGTILLIRRKRK